MSMVNTFSDFLLDSLSLYANAAARMAIYLSIYLYSSRKHKTQYGNHIQRTGHWDHNATTLQYI